jgi:hypothetical protein
MYASMVARSAPLLLGLVIAAPIVLLLPLLGGASSTRDVAVRMSEGLERDVELETQFERVAV